MKRIRLSLMLLLAAAPLRAGERAITLITLPTANTGAAPKLSVVPTLPDAVLKTEALSRLSLQPSSQLLHAQAASLEKGAAASKEAPTAFGGLQAIQAAGAEQASQKGGAEGSLSIGKKFDGAGRSVAGGVFSAGGEEAPFKAGLSNGVLTVRGADHPGVNASEELGVALKIFGRGVRAVTGGHAVRGLAAEHGFTTALAAEDGSLSLFVKPEDVIADKDGKPWRRSAVKREKSASWERFTDGKETIWILRRSDHGELLVAEYPGENIPKPGTPARALAVFSPDGGTYVDAAKAHLLDAGAERDAYYRF